MMLSGLDFSLFFIMFLVLQFHIRDDIIDLVELVVFAR